MNDKVLNQNTQSMVRAAIFEWLARLVADGQYEVNLNQAAHQALEILYRKGILLSQAPSNISFEKLYAHQVSEDIINSVTQIFWELNLQGILMPSPAWISSNTGYAIITHYGRTLISENSGRIQTHDPTGYLENFIKETPAPDTEMLRYIKESISVFQHGHFFACVILLGVASERLTTVLAENLRDSLGNPKGTEWFQKKFRGDTSERFRAIHNQLLAEYGEELEREKLKDALQSIVRLTFETIRHARNDIAHPKGREFTWNEVSGLLHNFVQYFKYTNKIIVVLVNNPKKQIIK